MGYANDIITAIGETVTVTIKSLTTDEWGKETETQVATGTTTASAQIIDSSDDEVKEGIMRTGDLITFFHPSDTYATYFDNDIYNIYITYNSNLYLVFDDIKEPASIESGHYELHARRV